MADVHIGSGRDILAVVSWVLHHGWGRRFVEQFPDGVSVFVERPEVVAEETFGIVFALQPGQTVPVLAVACHRARRRLMAAQKLYDTAGSVEIWALEGEGAYSRERPAN